MTEYEQAEPFYNKKNKNMFRQVESILPIKRTPVVFF